MTETRTWKAISFFNERPSETKWTNNSMNPVNRNNLESRFWIIWNETKSAGNSLRISLSDYSLTTHWVITQSFETLVSSVKHWNWLDKGSWRLREACSYTDAHTGDTQVLTESCLGYWTIRLTVRPIEPNRFGSWLCTQEEHKRHTRGRSDGTPQRIFSANLMKSRSELYRVI